MTKIQDSLIDSAKKGHVPQHPKPNRILVIKECADLSGVDLSGANLSGANLTDCKDVTLEQLLQTESLHGAILPDYINPADLGGKWSPPINRDNTVEVDSRTTNLGDQPIDKLLQPPALATYLLYFVPRKHRGDLIGDLAEEFQDINHEHGHRKAIIWYWWQVIASYWPFLKWLLLGWIVDAVRRFIS